MATVIHSFCILGIQAYLVDIEVDTLYGQPSLSIVGLGDQAVKESRERLEASIINCKFEFPKMKILINLSPKFIALQAFLKTKADSLLNVPFVPLTITLL